MKIITTVTWVVLLSTAVLLALTVPALGDAEDTAGVLAHISQMDKIEVLLWFIGTLVLCIGALLVIMSKILWTAHQTNRDEHASITIASTNLCTALTKRHIADSEKQWEAITELRDILGPLQGQHDAAFSLKGCAYEPEALEKTIRKIFYKILDEWQKKGRNIFSKDRKDDKPPYCEEHELPGGIGGD